MSNQLLEIFDLGLFPLPNTRFQHNPQPSYQTPRYKGRLRSLVSPVVPYAHYKV